MNNLVKPGDGASAIVNITLPAQQNSVAWAHKHINATLAAFGPDEAISMTQDTWAKLREAMSVLIEQTPQQEPVAIEHCLWARNGNTPCPHTAPPQRTWEEWFKWWRTSKVADSTEAEIDFADFMLIVRAVEAEYGIKEKNT